MTWVEGVLHILDTFEIYSGYLLGIISFGVLVIAIILFPLFMGAVGTMIDDTIKELNEK